MAKITLGNKPLVMNNRFFLLSLILVFTITMLGSLFPSLSVVLFAVCCNHFSEKCKVLSKKVEELGDDEVGWK